VTELKLGKLPAKPRSTDLMFAHYRDSASLSHPSRFGHYDIIPRDGWGMLGNDRYGDCVWAGAAHETMLWNKEAGRTVTFDDKSVLSDYAACTGFDPVTGANDNGTDVHNALSYRRHTGIVDASGKRHKIGAYVAIEPGNYEHLLDALYLFSAVGIGFEFPDYAIDEFNAGKPWTYRKGGTIEGGHYVCLVGKPNSLYIDPVSWAHLTGMTKRFFEHYCDEAYGILSTEMLNAQGVTLEGFNLAQLQDDIKQLGTPNQ